jgi:two-component system, OmpR family, KDP operon response regulator KdpE
MGDDEPAILRARQILTREAGKMRIFPTWSEALAAVPETLATATLPDLLLGFCAKADAELPQTFHILRAQCDAPLVLVLPRTLEAYVDIYIQSGVDDFLIHPYEASTLLARLRLALQHHAAIPPQPSALYRDAYLLIDPDWHHLVVDGEEVSCTLIEMKILDVLVRNRNRTVSYASLLETIWRGQDNAAPDLLHRHISHLRHKLEPDPRHPRYLITYPGVGYRFVPRT